MSLQPDLGGEQGYPYPVPLSRARRQAGDDQAAGVDVWAQARVRLETAAAAMETHCRRYERLWATLHQVQVTGPALSSVSVPPVLAVDRPDILGPHTGYWWDIRRFSFAPPSPAAPWAGSVYLYNSLVSPVNLIAVYYPSTPGSQDRISRFFAKATLLLGPHERLVYAAGPDFAGEAVPGGTALLIESDCVPVYLR